jgi:hypothetical protein
MAPLSYGRHRFPPEVIQHAIWLYLRFTLSYQDVEELLAERGLDGHTTAALSAAQPHRGTEGSNPFPSSRQSVSRGMSPSCMGKPGSCRGVGGPSQAAGPAETHKARQDHANCR